MSAHPEVGSVISAESGFICSGCGAEPLGSHAEDCPEIAPRPDHIGDVNEMVSIPRGPAVTDPEAFDDCLACNGPSLKPATTELSRNLGQLKPLEPPASDVAGWLALVMANVNRVYGDGLGPLKCLSELDPIQRNAWLEEAGLVLNGKSPLAAAPPHPASKEPT